MLCKRCMNVMAAGTTYEPGKDGKSSARRFYRCKRCNNIIYTKEPNFQGYMNKSLEKYRNG